MLGRLDIYMGNKMDLNPCLTLYRESQHGWIQMSTRQDKRQKSVLTPADKAYTKLTGDGRIQEMASLRVCTAALPG